MGIKTPMVDLALEIRFETNLRDFNSRVHMEIGGGFRYKLKGFKN